MKRGTTTWNDRIKLKPTQKWHRHKHMIKHQGTLTWQAKQQSKPFLIWFNDESNKDNANTVYPTWRPNPSIPTEQTTVSGMAPKVWAIYPSLRRKSQLSKTSTSKIPTLNQRIFEPFEPLHVIRPVFVWGKAPQILVVHMAPQNWARKIAFIPVSWLFCSCEQNLTANYDVQTPTLFPTRHNRTWTSSFIILSHETIKIPPQCHPKK